MTVSMFMLNKKDIILSVFSGLLLAAGFPSVDFFPLAWIALVPLMISLLDKGMKPAFILGMLSGFVYFFGTVFWVYNSIFFYGHLPAALSAVLVAALCIYLSMYVAVFSMLFNYLTVRSRFPALFIAPVLWVALEFLRTYALTGFPWALLGYSQYKFLTIIQIADITGVYGVSFLIAAVNGAVFDVFFNLPKRLKEMPLSERWPFSIGLIILCIAIIASLLYGVLKLHAGGGNHTVRASVVQGNIDQDKKWDISFQRETISEYKALTATAVSASPSLIVWPETAVPFIFGYDETLTAEITEFGKTLGAHLIFGGVTIKGIKDGRYQLSNSAILLSPDGNVLSVYDKIHLVPYGEYVPLRKLFPFVNRLVEGIGDFIPGRQNTVMETPFAGIGSIVCYEIVFPGLVRKFVNNGANLLVTVTNDAWFGRYSAPYQHFSMAVFRAVENRVPVIRAANTGVSGFIDAHGRIKRKSDIFVRAVLTEDLETGAFKKSFYTKYGDLFAFLCIISTILLIADSIKMRNEK